jgi:hypothetical protein
MLIQIEEFCRRILTRAPETALALSLFSQGEGSERDSAL